MLISAAAAAFSALLMSHIFSPGGSPLAALGKISGNVLRTDQQAGSDGCWTRTIEDPRKVTLNEIISVEEDGYVLGGIILNEEGDNAADRPWMMKTDFRGNVIWRKEYDVPFSLFGRFLKTSDGYAFAASFSEKAGADLHNYFFIIAKTDFDGNLIWKKLIAESSPSFPYGFIQTSDGGFLFSSASIKEMKIRKLDDTGEHKWMKVYSQKRLGTINVMKEIGDSGYELVGIRGDDDSNAVIARVELEKSGKMKSFDVISESNKIWVFEMWERDDGAFVFSGSDTSAKDREDYVAGILDGSGRNEPVIKILEDKAQAYAFMIKTPGGGILTGGVTALSGKCWDEAYPGCDEDRESVNIMESPSKISLVKMDADLRTELREEFFGGGYFKNLKAVPAPGSGYFIAGVITRPEGDTALVLAGVTPGAQCSLELAPRKGKLPEVEAAKRKEKVAMEKNRNKYTQLKLTREKIKDAGIDEFAVYQNDKCWLKTFGETSVLFRVPVIPDGRDGFVVGFSKRGRTKNSFEDTAVFMRFNKKGEALWSVEAEGAVVTDMARTPDGGVVVSGGVNLGKRNTGGPGMWMMKMDIDGQKKWDRSFGGKYAISVAAVADGGYGLYGVAAGTDIVFDTNPAMLKTDGMGKEEWATALNMQNPDIGEMLQPSKGMAAAKDGGFFTSATTFGSNGSWTNAFITKIDRYGDIEWKGSFSNTDVADGCEINSIVSVPGIGFIAAGNWEEFRQNRTGVSMGYEDMDYDFRVLLSDGDGSIIWDRRFGGDRYDDASGAIPVSDGGYIVVGSTRSFGYCFTENLDVCDERRVHFQESSIEPRGNILVIKLDSAGQKIWSMTIGGPESEYGYSIVEMPSGGFLVSGASGSDQDAPYKVLLARIDEKGTCRLDL